MKLLIAGFHRCIAWQSRKYSSKSTGRRKQESSWETKVSAKIYKHFESQNKIELLKLFPGKLLHIKRKLPLTFYITDENTAKVVADIVTSDLPKGMTVAEINPGPGLLTKELLKRDVSKLLLFEANNEFSKTLEEFHCHEPERVKLQMGDFLNLWKLHFRDKLDNGSRLDDLLRNVPRKQYDDDVNMRLVGGVGYYDFFKHLINSLTFQNSITAFGRPEMFFIMPPPLFIHLTCGSEIGYLIYRATSILFQIMFEYRFITSLPREHFLPWQYEYNLSKTNKLTRVKSINPEFLYLVKMVPRRNLYDLCPPEDMPALWYFIKQNCTSRKNRVIPNLERWVPGCGPRLIINTNKSEIPRQLYPDEDISSIPPFSKPCTTMSTKNFYPGMNIFTEFGDLSPSHMLTLFKQFRNWPEYKEGIFLASLESNLIKMEVSSEERVDGLEIIEEDDRSADSISNPLQYEVEEKTRGHRKG